VCPEVCALARARPEQLVAWPGVHELPSGQQNAHDEWAFLHEFVGSGMGKKGGAGVQIAVRGSYGCCVVWGPGFGAAMRELMAAGVGLGMHALLLSVEY